MLQRSEQSASLSDHDRIWLLKQAVRLALDVGLSPFISHVLTALTVVVIFWPGEQQVFVLFWFGALALTVGAQGVFVHKTRGQGITETCARRVKRVFEICGLLIGVAWAGLFTLVFPTSADYTIIYLAFAAGGLSMGAVATQHMLPWGAILAFSVSLACLALQFILTGFPNGYFHAFCIVLYAAVMVHLSFRLQRLSLKAARLQVEQKRLLEQIANDRVLRAQADERQRVARDMHDSVGQWLGSVKLRLQTIGAEVRSGEAIDEPRLAELIGDMDVLIDDTRRIAHDLSPSSVEHKGFFKALAEHMRYLDDDHGIAVHLDLDESVHVQGDHADHLYRIVQEAANNAVIHGSADWIAISLTQTDKGRLCLTIKDNGIGFDTETKQNRHSLGLTSIRERAASMNGQVTITSAPDQGTRIEVLI
ncbi:sensor histidine kinase [Coralliovum pocilloporae]|uniref:sensor histidine kinase n=1 Tax=Coralliovum pocilloporae TaxID=3066369 RepID=UPI0033077D8B